MANRLHGDVRLIKGAGHYPQLEMPEQTGPEIVAFIRMTWVSALQAA